MGSTFNVSGKVTLDTGQAQQGAKQVESEIQKLTQSGVAGFDQTRERVEALRKQIETLKQALARSQDPTATKQLTAALGEAEGRMRALTAEANINRLAMAGAGAATGNLRAIQAEAATKAMLLGQQLGVVMPTAIQRLVTSTAGLRAAIGAAFGVGVLLYFGQALVNLIPKVVDLIDRFREVKDVQQDVLDKQFELNRAFGAFGKVGSLDALNRESIRLSANVKELETKIRNARIELQNFGAPHPVFGVRLPAFTTDQIKAWEQELERAKKRLEEVRFAIPSAELAKQAEAHRRAAEWAKDHAEKIKLLADHEKDLIPWLERHKQLGIDLRDLNAEQVGQLVTFVDHQKKLREEFEKTGGAVLAAQNHFRDIARAEQHAQGALEREAAIRAAGLAEAVKGATEYNRALGEIGDNERRMAEEAKRTFEQTASAIEGFIDRVFLTARSLSDVFHQFLTQLLGSFTKFVSREIAAAILGMRQASGATAGGGILGAILGTGFGGGGGSLALASGGGVLAGTVPLALGTTFGGIAIPGSDVTGAITGAAGGGIPRAVGGASSGALGTAAFEGIGGLLTLGLGTAGLGGVLGSALGAGSPSGGALRGALGGGLIGGAIGAAWLGSLSLGLYALGPFGAAIGAVIGLVSGILGRGKRKRQATAIEESIIGQAETVALEYKRFKLEFEAALTALDGLRVVGFEQTRPLGRPGRNAFEHIRLYISQRKSEIDAIEQERQRRAFAISSMPLPEFARGGPVSSGVFGLPGGGQLAVLHPDEWVLTRNQRAMLGDSFLRSLPKFESGGPVSSGGPGAFARSSNVTVGPINIFQQPGESSGALAERVAGAITDRLAARIAVRGFRRARLDGAL